jgi:hypothetical protein
MKGTRSTNYANRGCIQAIGYETSGGNISSLRLEANVESSQNLQSDLVFSRVK